MSNTITLSDTMQFRVVARFIGKINRCYAFERANGGLILFEKCRTEMVDSYALDSDMFLSRLFGVHYRISKDTHNKFEEEICTITELVILTQNGKY